MLHHHLHIHGFVGLQAYHELIATSVAEYVPWNILELDTNLCLPLIKCWREKGGRREGKREKEREGGKGRTKRT